MISSLRLVRPINLFIIAITMYGCRFFVLTINGYQKIHDNSLAFFGLVLSTLLIAAGGNIINDYFDIKADKINKPDKLIVGNLIDKRKAILLHWIVNGVALLIAIVLSIVLNSSSIVLIHVLAINVLWFYSLYFKRKLFIGNFLIALLTGVIPLLVVIYFEALNNLDKPFSPFHENSWSVNLNYNFIYLLALMAFLQNLAREILKDMEDMKGDKEIRATTIPMVLGIQRTKVIISGLLIFTPLLYFFFVIDNQFSFYSLNFVSSLGWLIAVIIDLIGIGLLTFSKSSDIRKNHLLIKLSMFFGILTTYHVYLLSFL